MKNTDSKAKKHIITIAGRPGSGKSTAAKLVALELGFDHFSSGDLFRALGKERGVDVFRANQKPGVTEELDRLVDGKLQEVGRKDDRIIIDSRTAWHWIPNSFKVFLDLDLKIAAERILAELNADRVVSEKIHSDATKYAQMLQKRLDVETSRYKAIYDIDPYDMSNYDLIIDTDSNSISQVVDQVVSGFKKWIKEN